MESDELPTITDPTDAAWVTAQRPRVIQYLASQQLEHAGVSLEPRWFLSPYLAIWAVRSKTNPNRIGWWVISGDVPTDYLPLTNEHDDADVLLAFAQAWKAAATYMANGHWAPNHHIGPPGTQKQLAPLLRSRAETLESYARTMKAGNTETND